MAWTGIWRGASDVDGQSGWNCDHANKMLYMAPARIMWGGAASEIGIKNWAAEDSSRPTLMAGNRTVLVPSEGYKCLCELVELTEKDKADIEGYVDDILDQYGSFNGISGWMIHHQQEMDSDAELERFAWVRDRIRTCTPGKNYFGNGDVDSISSSFFPELWEYSEGVFLAQKYVWYKDKYGDADMQNCVTWLENEWRHTADKKISGKACKWMGLVSAHRDDTEGREYRWPTEEELLLSALGPIAHGGLGTAFYVFDGPYDPEEGIECLYPDPFSTHRTHVKNAITRINQVEGYLSGWAYNGCEYNTEGNAYKDLYDSLGWMLRRLEAGGFTWDKKVEIGRFGGDPSSYVICNRDPRDGGGRDVTAYFYSPSEIKVDGALVEGGELQTSWTFNLPQGDAKVLTVM